jgi:hypothetical protein
MFSLDDVLDGVPHAGSLIKYGHPLHILICEQTGKGSVQNAPWSRNPDAARAGPRGRARMLQGDAYAFC